MARRGRCAPARSTAKSPTAFAANGAPRSTPISDPSSKPHGEDRSEPSTPSASPSRAAPCLAQLENVNGDLSNYDEIMYSNAIILGRVGAYCGSVEYCKGPFCASDNTIVVAPCADRLNVLFGYYLLRDANLNRHAGGAAQPLLTQSRLRPLEFAVPGLDQQDRIA